MGTDWLDEYDLQPAVIPASASPRNRARWQRLLDEGWRSIRRGGTGCWVHPDRPHAFFSTAAALLAEEVPG